MAGPNRLLRYVEENTDLDVIAITDHDSIRGALKVRDRWARNSYRFQVITGMEVTTIEGHLLALFVDEPLPCLRPAAETIDAIHRIGGICVVPHPFTWLTRGMGLRDVRRVASDLDGLEVTNRTPAGRIGAARARRLNSMLFGLAEVGGSDAHFLQCISAGYTEFAGRSAEDLRNAILSRTTRGISVSPPTLREIGYSQVIRQTYRGIMSTPRALGWGPTAVSFVRRIATFR